MKRSNAIFATGCWVLATAAAMAAPAPPLAATKSASYPTNPNQRATPGDKIRYDQTLTNNSGNPATNLSFADPTPAGTTHLGQNVSPLALDDSYSAVGNTLLRVGIMPSSGGPETVSNLTPTANDREFFNDTFTVTRVMAVSTVSNGTITATSTNGGTVVMYVYDGSFTYLPPAGFQGTDTFTYTISDDGTEVNPPVPMSDTATVTITVADMLWYVDSSAASGGDGRSTRPFNSLTPLNGANGSGDADAINQTICLYPGTYTTGLQLEDGQKLLARSHGFFSGNTQVLGASGANPTLEGGLVAGFSNTVQGVNLGTSASRPALSGTTVGTLTMNSATAGLINNTSGAAVAITSSGTLNLTFTSVTCSGGSTYGIRLVSCSGTFTANGGALSNTSTTAAAVQLEGGSLDFTYKGNVIDANGPLVVMTAQNGGTKLFTGEVSTGASGNGSGGIELTSTHNNTIFNFEGKLTLNSGSAASLKATGASAGNGTLRITHDSNTISNTNATALQIKNINISSDGVKFRSISSSGGENIGIVLDDTGTAGSFTLTGSGFASRSGNGGTIQNKTGTDGSTTAGIGIYLRKTKAPTLRELNLVSFSNQAIFATEIDGLSLNYTTINGSFIGTVGTSTRSNDAAIGLGLLNWMTSTNGFTGTVTINQCEINNSAGSLIEGYLNTGTATLNITNCNLHDSTSTTGADAILLETAGNANATVLIKDNTITNARSQAVQVNAAGTSRVTATVQGNSVSRSGGTPQGNEGIVLTSGQDAWLTASVTGNTLTGLPGAAIFVGQIPGNASSSSDLRATISSNNITAPTGALNHAICAYLSSTAGASAPARVLITSNTINQQSTTGVARAISVDGPDADTTPGVDATVTSNTVTMGSSAAPGAIYVNSRRALLRGEVRSNSVTYSNTPAAGTYGITVRQFAPGSLELGRGTQTSTDPAAVLAANNPAATTSVVGTVSLISSALVKLPSDPLLLAATTSQTATPTPAIQNPAPALAVEAVETVEATPAPVAPVMPHAPEAADVLDQAKLDALVEVAIARWEASGLSAAQRATLRGLRIELGDLAGMHLGAATGTQIRINPTAAGNTWFIDPAPAAGKGFGAPGSPELGQVDLLTVLMHEMGHALGLPDTYDSARRNELMFGMLGLGERRLPSAGQARQATSGAAPTQFLAATLSISTLPAGKSVRVVYDVQIPANSTATSITSTGVLTASGLASASTPTVVVPVEQPPALSDIALQTDEDTALTFTAASFDAGFADPNNDAPAKVLITALPASGTLKYNNNNVTVPLEVSRANLGGLVYLPAPDTSGTTTVTWNATDGAGYAASSAQLTITIAEVNDPPTLAAIATPAAILEDANTQTINLTGISTGGGETQTLTLSAVSNNPALVPDPAVDFTSPASTAALSYKPARDQYGTAVVTVTLTDNGSPTKSVEQTFTITVTPVNDAPSVLVNQFPAPLNASAATQVLPLNDLTAGPNEPGQQINLTAVSSNPALIPNPTVNFTPGTPTGSLTFTPVAAATGTSTIILTVHDNGGTANGGSDTTIVTIPIIVSPNIPLRTTRNSDGQLLLDAPTVAGRRYRYHYSFDLVTWYLADPFTATTSRTQLAPTLGVTPPADQPGRFFFLEELPAEP